jgi:hypothetical protein
MTLRKICKAPNGQPMAVIRPANPRLALAMAVVAVQKNDADLFARLPGEVGNYTCVGWLAEGTDGVIVDDEGHPIDKLRAGDSMVSE